jgi:hypothetical protein
MESQATLATKVNPPGPGNYELPSFPNDHPASHVQSAAKFSMGRGRAEPAKRSDVADPGKYHPKLEATMSRSAAWGFGSAKRMMSEPSKHKTPGPSIGQIDNPNYFKSPRYGFGTSERSALSRAGESEKSKRPGPGQHNPNIDVTSKMNSVPCYTASPRREVSMTSKAPGPGSYSISDSANLTWGSIPRVKFGTATRSHKERTGRAPGPGQYSVMNMTKTGHASMGDSAPKWSMTGRPSFKIAKDTC